MKQLFLYSVLLFVFFVSCDDSDHPELELEKRTVICYMVGDNNLSDQTDLNLEALMAGTTKEKLNNGNLVVYMDSRKEEPKILEIKVEADKVVSKLVKTYSEQNSASPRVMKNVLADIKKQFPAKHYGLVLWSHGSAWLPKNAESMIVTRSFGDDSGNVMDIDVLKDVLADGVHYDFILFDACYMASVEVAYELRKVTDYLVASPMEIIAEGFPYKEIVGEFFSFPANLRGICEDFYNYYANHKNGGDYRTASISLVETKKLELLASAMNKIMKKHKKELSSVNLDKLQQLEYYHSKRLLYDLDEYVQQLASDEEYAVFRKALTETILYEVHTPTSFFAKPFQSFAIEKCCGLTVYPLSFNPKLDKWYERLEWYDAVYK